MALPSLTIGMACYNDFDGVYFSVQALRLYHADALDGCEILVVDNHPGSPAGKTTRALVENWAGGRYVRLATSSVSPVGRGRSSGPNGRAAASDGWRPTFSTLDRSVGGPDGHAKHDAAASHNSTTRARSPPP